MQKKNTTASKRRASLDSHLEAQLAALIAAVLAHPFTPSRLYNVIVDELLDMLSGIPGKESTDTPEFIECVLNWHQGFGFRNIERKGAR